PNVEGRKPLDQILPVDGVGRPITTNAGKTCDSLPSPYTAHEPSDGRPVNGVPQCSIICAVEWLNWSVTTEWIMHRSSAHVAVCGSQSENAVPHWPWQVKVRGLAQTWAVGLMKASLSPSPRASDSGSGFPSHFLISGFGTNSSN